MAAERGQSPGLPAGHHASWLRLAPAAGGGGATPPTPVFDLSTPVELQCLTCARPFLVLLGCGERWVRRGIAGHSPPGNSPLRPCDGNSSRNRGSFFRRDPAREPRDRQRPRSARDRAAGGKPPPGVSSTAWRFFHCLAFPLPSRLAFPLPSRLKTPPLPCVSSTAVAATDAAFALRFYCRCGERHRLCLAFSTAVAGERRRPSLAVIRCSSGRARRWAWTRTAPTSL